MEGCGGVRNSFVVASWYFCPLQKNILADYLLSSLFHLFHRVGERLSFLYGMFCAATRVNWGTRYKYIQNIIYRHVPSHLLLFYRCSRQRLCLGQLQQGSGAKSNNSVKVFDPVLISLMFRSGDQSAGGFFFMGSIITLSEMNRLCFHLHPTPLVQ